MPIPQVAFDGDWRCCGCQLLFEAGTANIQLFHTLIPKNTYFLDVGRRNHTHPDETQV